MLTKDENAISLRNQRRNTLLETTNNRKPTWVEQWVDEHVLTNRSSKFPRLYSALHQFDYVKVIQNILSNPNSSRSKISKKAFTFLRQHLYHYDDTHLTIRIAIEYNRMLFLDRLNALLEYNGRILSSYKEEVDTYLQGSDLTLTSAFLLAAARNSQETAKYITKKGKYSILKKDLTDQENTIYYRDYGSIIYTSTMQISSIYSPEFLYKLLEDSKVKMLIQQGDHKDLRKAFTDKNLKSIYNIYTAYIINNIPFPKDLDQHTVEQEQAKLRNIYNALTGPMKKIFGEKGYTTILDTILQYAPCWTDRNPAPLDRHEVNKITERCIYALQKKDYQYLQENIQELKKFNISKYSQFSLEEINKIHDRLVSKITKSMNLSDSDIEDIKNYHYLMNIKQQIYILQEAFKSYGLKYNFIKLLKAFTINTEESENSKLAVRLTRWVLNRDSDPQDRISFISRLIQNPNINTNQLINSCKQYISLSKNTHRKIIEYLLNHKPIDCMQDILASWIHKATVKIDENIDIIMKFIDYSFTNNLDAETCITNSLLQASPNNVEHILDHLRKRIENGNNEYYKKMMTQALSRVLSKIIISEKLDLQVIDLIFTKYNQMNITFPASKELLTFIGNQKNRDINNLICKRFTNVEQDVIALLSSLMNTYNWEDLTVNAILSIISIYNRTEDVSMPIEKICMHIKHNTPETFKEILKSPIVDSMSVWNVKTLFYMLLDNKFAIEKIIPYINKMCSINIQDYELSECFSNLVIYLQSLEKNKGLCAYKILHEVASLDDKTFNTIIQIALEEQVFGEGNIDTMFKILNVCKKRAENIPIKYIATFLGKKNTDTHAFTRILDILAAMGRGVVAAKSPLILTFLHCIKQDKIHPWKLLAILDAIKQHNIPNAGANGGIRNPLAISPEMNNLIYHNQDLAKLLISQPLSVNNIMNVNIDAVYDIINTCINHGSIQSLKQILLSIDVYNKAENNEEDDHDQQSAHYITLTEEQLNYCLTQASIYPPISVIQTEHLHNIFKQVRNVPKNIPNILKAYLHYNIPIEQGNLFWILFKFGNNNNNQYENVIQAILDIMYQRKIKIPQDVILRAYDEHLMHLLTRLAEDDWGNILYPDELKLSQDDSCTTFKQAKDILSDHILQNSGMTYCYNKKRTSEQNADRTHDSNSLSNYLHDQILSFANRLSSNEHKPTNYYRKQ